MRIMLYFGSFNPIHIGHMALAEYVLKEKLSEELWFVLSPQNPLKQASELMPDEERIGRIRKAISHKEHMQICDVELTMPRPNYTINTLNRLTDLYPSHQFSILIGADNAQIFQRWRDAELIYNHFPIYVYPRKSSEPVNCRFPQMHILANAPIINISSTAIRNRMAAGMPVDDMIP